MRILLMESARNANLNLEKCVKLIISSVLMMSPLASLFVKFVVNPSVLSVIVMM